MTNPTWPTEWLMQTIILIWNHYLFTGDDSIIRNNLELIESHALKAFVDDQIGLIKTTNIQENDIRLKKLNRIGIIRDIVDWPQADEDKEFDFAFTDYNAVVNAYHYYVSCILAKIYNLMDMDEKYHEWDAYSTNFKHIYNNNFLDRTKGLYRDGLMKDTQHCSIYPNMFALCFGLVPDEYKNNIARYVSDQGLKCSVFNAQFLLQALFMNNHQQEAIDLITNTGTRSWINMINVGSTITTEAWSSEIKPNQDWNHAWGAAPANLIQFYLMGIRPIDPGFSKAIIQPRLGDLKTASCILPTKHGGIELSIKRDLEYFDMSFSIPEDISCDIIIPSLNDDSSELYLDGLNWADFEETDEGLILYDLNGNHRITLSKGNNIPEFIEETNINNIYNVNGIKVTENNNEIIISNKKKFIQKNRI